ncbi:MAG TPA: C25 family cysteine peptidase [Candidatus Polarisedimenticolaceae bacterium]|nr:C25 family cysteine peptidase [Candidatus Polarisedimenticolaceae bacterium]
MRVISTTRRLGVAAMSILAVGSSLTAIAAGSTDPQLLRSDDAAIELRVTFDPPRATALPAIPGSADLTVVGLPRHRVIGEPALPFRSVLVAVPPDAELRLEIDDPRPTPIAGLRPAPFERQAGDDGPLAIATEPSRGRPFEAVEIDFDGYLRDRRVVRLLFHPLTLDPAGLGTIYHPELTARLVAERRTGARVFVGRPGARVVGADGPSSLSGRPAERALYERTILNEHTIDDGAYRAVLRASRPEAGWSDLPSSSSLRGTGPLPAKIPVRGEDVWSVTHAALLAAGFDASGLAVSALSLTSGCAPVPLHVVDGGDGTFDAGDRIEFYGVGISGEIEYDVNVYRLAFDEGPGISPTTRDATPAGGTAPPSFTDTRRVEENLVFFTTRADSDGDQIGWERVVASSAGNATASYQFTLPDVDPAAVTIRIRARIYDLGGSHTTSILLNGVDLMDARSWSTGDVTHDATISAANLVPGTNTLTMQLSGSSFNQVVFNWFEVDYPRLYRAESDRLAFTADLPAPVAHQVSGFTTSDIVVYDVTDPNAPARLDGVQISGFSGDYSAAFSDTLGGERRFLARAGTSPPGGPWLVDQTSALGSTANGADLIVLAYRDFLDEMVPLVDARTAQGWRVALVDLEDVFDEYACGRPDPMAIKSFLADAYLSWQAPSPAFLLLVGNATLDPLQQLPDSVPPLMPTGRFTAPTLGLAASDNALVTIVGDDPLPDLFVGRIPARTDEQAAAAVAKIVAYDDVPPSRFGQGVLLAADNDDLAFEYIQEDLVTLYMSETRIPVERAYLRLLGAGGTNQQIRSTINLGALTTNYLGHGNVHNWAAENVLVDSSDIPLLTNSDRPTFMTTLNCINGFHAGPRGTSLDALAEQALVAPNGGAVAVWGPSALALLSDYTKISEVLYRQLFVDREQRLGVATTVAKVEAVTQFGTSVANLEEMHLFGDPTTVLRVDGDLDGLTDDEEDRNGLAARDADSDDDGRDDGVEPLPPADSDGDGRTDAFDPDSDDDGLPDGLESGIVVPGPDTDPTRGHFVPDADPLTMTDPADADTDGGGAPDGAEDRSADGQVGPGETDPLNPADDPGCATEPPAEVSGLLLAKSGDDATLSWSDQSASDPCVLYRVYVATDAAPSDGAAFLVEATTTLAGWDHRGAVASDDLHFYLVTAITPIAGEGPRGHHGQ